MRIDLLKKYCRFIFLGVMVDLKHAFIVVLAFLSIACSGLWEENSFKYYPQDISKIILKKGLDKQIVQVLEERENIAVIVGFLDFRTEVEMPDKGFQRHLELITVEGKVLEISFKKGVILYNNKQYELNSIAFEFLDSKFQ